MTLSRPDALLELLRRRGTVQTAEAAKALGVSRMTAWRRLRELAADKRVVSQGSGRAASWELAGARLRLALKGLQEHEVARQLEPTLRALFSLSEADAAAIHYALTEMVNNAIDHSGGKHVVVEARRRGPWLELVVSDDGAGVFATLRKRRGLASDQDAIVQLEKGKLTTMPERHSGEGIFFTSKIAHRFRLESGALAWLVDKELDERSIEAVDPPRRGTRVVLAFKPGAIEPYEEVFARYTTGEDHRFAKTRVTVRLVDTGASLLSRSEAKRVVAGLERFEHITLDFQGVTHVGQGFVDEVFRVFASAHPRIELQPIRMDEAVAFMVQRSVSLAPGPAVPIQTGPAPALAAEPAFFLQKPERFLRAWTQLASADRATTELQLTLTARCLRALLALTGDDGEARARLGTCFEKGPAEELLELLSVERALARLDAVDEAKLAALAPRGLGLAQALLSRIAEQPLLWRYFVDDEGMARFWALPPEERRKPWGEPIARGARSRAEGRSPGRGEG